MALKVAISHKTVYKYSKKVSLSPHIFRLRPAPHSRTPIESYSLKIKPENHFFNWQQDAFGNYLARIVFQDKTEEMSVDVEIIADLKTINPFDFFVEESAEEFPFEYDEATKKELQAYLEVEEKGKLIDDFIANVDVTPRKTIYFLIDLNMQVYKHMTYNIRMEPGVQTCEESLECKSGSCRDFAWMMIQILRNMGFAARFVSGYIVQLSADEKSLDGPSGPAQDFTDLHAWVEVFLPGAGWVGFDPTSGLLVGEGHIPLACTPHYNSAAPVTGMTDVCETEFEFSNSVERLVESPRVTKPYTESQWKDILKLGNKVEKELVKNDVRLTMGGEPTFVSIDDMESPQWNTDADGPHKRQLANDLTKRLLDKVAIGGALHNAQGKWYPGEPLPRWSTELYWRKDGKKIWHNTAYMSSFSPNAVLPDNAAQLFLNTLTGYLNVSNQHIIPALEDVYHQLWEQANLPIDAEGNTENDFLQKELADILSKGNNLPKGYVLPLNNAENVWYTSEWHFRRNNLFLTVLKLEKGNSIYFYRL